MKKKINSFFDNKKNLAVDCTECERGINGNDKDKCSCGWNVKKPGMYCFIGKLISTIDISEIKNAND